MSAGKTDTFLGDRYRRIARRRGNKRAIVALGRSILVIVWHLLSDPETLVPFARPRLYFRVRSLMVRPAGCAG